MYGLRDAPSLWNSWRRANGPVVRRNLVANPGFEANRAGWNKSGGSSSASLTRTRGGHSGSWGARAANSGSSAATCMLNDSPNWVRSSSPGVYTAGLWVRAQRRGARLKLRLREYVGGTLAGGKTRQFVLGTSWQHVTVDYSPANPGASTVDYNAYVTGAPPGTCFYADDASLELR